MTSAVGKDIPLGKDTRYVSSYTPSLLRSIDRGIARRLNGVSDPVPFHGEDLWTCYELSWLNGKGRPEVAVASFKAPCSSPCIVESKSLKLYLNSFAQTRFSNRVEVHSALDSDLAVAFRAPVIVELHDVQHVPFGSTQFPGRSLDHLDVAVDRYDVAPDELQLDEGDVVARETLYTNLFRSLCPVTGQPDWASVMVQYVGRRISHAGLLRYLVSFREHDAFHEDTVERIFVDVRECCAPEQLTIYGRFLRRGGVEINPYRSTQTDAAPAVRLPRQ